LIGGIDMRIGISSDSMGLDAKVSERFGRTDYFVIVEDGKLVKTIENKAKNEASGAGNMAVRLLSEENVEIALVPELGPKAMTALKAFDIKAYSYNIPSTVQEAVDSFKEGNLKELKENTHEGHHGLRRA
jgi:predicted Fe-Mo cluster-binding NifX family protein